MVVSTSDILFIYLFVCLFIYVCRLTDVKFLMWMMILLTVMPG